MDFDTISTNANGLKTEFAYEADGDRLIVKYSQDVEPFLKANRELQKDKSLTRSKSGELRYVARIPDGVIMQWFKEGINIFDKADWNKVKAKLNDPDYRDLRTDISVI